MLDLRPWLEAFYDQERRFWIRGSPSCLIVMPGFDKEIVRPGGLTNDRYDGETYRTMWREALRMNPQWVLINTFNEWYESSQIEPSIEHGAQALQDTTYYTEEFRRMRPLI